MTARKYRALSDLALRQSSKPGTPGYDLWHQWAEGEVFEAPAHMDAKRMVASGKIEEVKGE